MKINKSHPKYHEYIAKGNAIAQRQKEEWDRLEIPNGKDGISGEIVRKYAKELKQLKSEYSFLFSED